MDHVATNQFTVPQYKQLLTEYDPERRAVWHYFNPSPRPCFTPQVLSDIADFQEHVRQYRSQSWATADAVRYMVMASATPAIYNLGGDLDLFVRHIVSRDGEGLRDYAYRCVDCVIGNAQHLGQDGLTTISLVQGKALGGGFEAALSCNVVIAERGSLLGFPEILFNLFPGMGAYSLLIRRIEPIRAERLLRSGEQYSAETLHEMGVVDVLADKGEGVHAVNDYIRRHERGRNGLQAIQKLREWNNPLTREELIRITDMWVERALQISTRDLRTMMRLASAQYRLTEVTSMAEAESRTDRVVVAAPTETQFVEERISAVAGR